MRNILKRMFLVCMYILHFMICDFYTIVAQRLSVSTAVVSSFDIFGNELFPFPRSGNKTKR